MTAPAHDRGDRPELDSDFSRNRDTTRRACARPLACRLVRVIGEMFALADWYVRAAIFDCGRLARAGSLTMASLLTCYVGSQRCFEANRSGSYLTDRTRKGRSRRAVRMFAAMPAPERLRRQSFMLAMLAASMASMIRRTDK